MASNVYGTPVTDATLKGMTEYHDKPIVEVDKARVALEMKNAEGKDIEARKFADNVQASINKKGVRCLIYNAIGCPLKLVAAFEYAGCVSESPFPTYILNGQWASFVHEKDNNSTASIACLVYEAIQGNPGQWVFGWYQTDNVISKCYGEILGRGTYSMNSSDAERQALRNLIEGSKFLHESQTNTGDVIFSSIGNTALPIYEAILTRNASI